MIGGLVFRLFRINWIVIYFYSIDWLIEWLSDWLIDCFIDWLINFRFDLESPESEKLTDSVSEKEEKEIDEVEAESKVNIHRREIRLESKLDNTSVWVLPGPN